MQPHDQLTTLVRQRTWNKELILWYGPEGKLRPQLEGIQIRDLDLLDLFTPGDTLPEDDEIRQHISRSLRQHLKSIPRAPTAHSALIVRSSGLLARYRVGVQDFYDWYCDDFAMVILLVDGSYRGDEWPEEVECRPDSLVEYFKDSGMVKRLIEA